MTDILESDRYLDSEFDDDDMLYDDIFNGNNNIMKNRNNMDSMINENGRKLISLCKSSGHIIANGRLHLRIEIQISQTLKQPNVFHHPVKAKI